MSLYKRHVNHALIIWKQLQLLRCLLASVGNLIIKIRWCHDTLIFIMGTHMSVRKVFIFKLVLYHIRKTHLYQVHNLICAARHYFNAPRRDMNSPMCMSGMSWCQAEPLDYIRSHRDIRMNGEHWPDTLISMEFHHNLYRHIGWFPNYTYIVWLFCFPHTLEAESSNEIELEWISK